MGAWRERVLEEKEKIGEKLLDEKKRYRFQLQAVYGIFTAVSLVMSLLNVITHKDTLLIATMAFCVVSACNLIYILRPKASTERSAVFFCASVLALFVFFIISGTPEGFSVLWICMLPSCGMLLLGRRKGTWFFALMLVLTIFFFQTEPGQAMLLYDYTQSFRLRFPFLLIAMYAVAWVLETIRVITHDALIKSREDYEYISVHDALTGVYNRYGFGQFIAECIESGKRAEHVIFLIADIDDFKQVNDRHGHLTGDRVLKETAAAIRSAMPEGARVCRWGGEEFAVILRGTFGREDAMANAEKLRMAVADRRVSWEGKTIGVTVSVGGVMRGMDENVTANALIRAADDSLYAAKAAGKNRCVIAKDESDRG